jgi:hypothetical protein
VIDVCHLHEAGVAMPLPTSYSWFPIGQRLRVPYHAPEGRRVNAIGAHFTHGSDAGHCAYPTWAALPTRRAKQQRTNLHELARAHARSVDDVGTIDSERVAGRPQDAPAGWKRARPFMIVLDTDAVHKRQTVVAAQPAVLAANVQLVYVPAYCPDLSAMEPVWNDVKQHRMPTRSFTRVVDLKRAVDNALDQKAQQLQQAYVRTTNFVHRVT